MDVRRLLHTTQEPWRATRRPHESWLAELTATHREVPAIFVVGLRLECIMIDVLHTLDQILAIIWECVLAKAWKENTQEGIVVGLWSEAAHSLQGCG